MQGRVQLEWRSTTQTRANNTRTWLNGQLTGRQFETPMAPTTYSHPNKGGWITQADIAFDTTAEGEVVRALVSARMSSDSTIAAGSWWQFHECPHQDGGNGCAASTVRTTK